MSLTAGTVLKAKNLVKKGFVKADEESDLIFFVKSSSGGHYSVKVADKKYKYDLYCECQGWKFHQDCSHCEAVRIFKKEMKN